MGLNKEDVEHALIAKLRKKGKMEKENRVDVGFMKMGRMERDDVHAKGLNAQKAEKARIKQVKEMTNIHTFIFVGL
jgi:hypothetical protein